MNGLTLSCLNIALTRVVWTTDTFEDNIGINHKFTKYLKESCGLDLDQYFSFQKSKENSNKKKKFSFFQKIYFVK